MPFRGRPGRIAAAVIKFYNQRLVEVAKRRLAAAEFAKGNSGWRESYDGFAPDFRVTKLLRKGLFRWWTAVLTNLRLICPWTRSAKPGNVSAAATVQA